MPKKILLPVLALLVIAAGVGWWSVRGGAGSAGSAGGGAESAKSLAAGASAAVAPPQVVNVYTVQRRDVPVRVEVAGTVVPLQSVEVRAQLSSTVREVVVKEGQALKRGDLLFTLDDRNERANVEKARAQLLRDRTTLADLERQFKRAQELRGQNFIAQSALDSAQTQFEAQQALLKSDEAALQAAEVALSNTVIRAPQAGRAGLVNVNPGSLVQPSGAALLTINQIDPIGVSFSVPEAQLGGLLAAAGITAPAASGLAPKVGAASTAGAGKPAELAVLLTSGGERRRGEPAPSLAGRLTFVDNAVDTTSGTIRAKGTVPNAQQQLWPGQYVSVRLTLRTLKDAVVLPQAAIIQRGAERTVYVVGADDRVQARSVQIRQPLGELVAVDGVDEGERVVVEGKQNLRPGGAVRIAAAPAGKGASGAAGAAGAASAVASGAR